MILKHDSRMSKADQRRMLAALNCDLGSVDSVFQATLGLQSTDAPELVPLYDVLSEIWAAHKSLDIPRFWTAYLKFKEIGEHYGQNNT